MGFLRPTPSRGTQRRQQYVRQAATSRPQSLGQRLGSELGIGKYAAAKRGLRRVERQERRRQLHTLHRQLQTQKREGVLDLAKKERHVRLQYKVPYLEDRVRRLKDQGDVSGAAAAEKELNRRMQDVEQKIKHMRKTQDRSFREQERQQVKEIWRSYEERMETHGQEARKLRTEGGSLPDLRQP